MNSPPSGRYCYDYPRPAVTVDVVALTGPAHKRRILLIRRGQDPFKGRWALPGGFVDIDEDLEPAARRELFEETGLEARALEQVVTVGTPGRDPRGRSVSVVYVGVFDQAPTPAAGDDAAEAQWFPLDALPRLAFDHDDVLTIVAQRLGFALPRAEAGDAS